jgi:hypothetical protein
MTRLMPKFDWTINMGEVLTAAALFLGFVTAHQQNIRKLQDIETRLGLVFQWFQNNVVNAKRRGDE